MKAVILRDNPESALIWAHALLAKGFQVSCVPSRKVAHALLHVETVDLLVVDEAVHGRLTHALALTAERLNPYVSTILATDRPGEQTDELFELIPSLYALIGLRTGPALLGQLALSSIENFAEVEARVRRLATYEPAEQAPEPVELAADDYARIPIQPAAFRRRPVPLNLHRAGQADPHKFAAHAPPRPAVPPVPVNLVGA